MSKGVKNAVRKVVSYGIDTRNPSKQIPRYIVGRQIEGDNKSRLKFHFIEN